MFGEKGAFCSVWLLSVARVYIRVIYYLRTQKVLIGVNWPATLSSALEIYRRVFVCTR